MFYAWRLVKRKHILNTKVISPLKTPYQVLQAQGLQEEFYGMYIGETVYSSQSTEMKGSQLIIAIV